jgi:hypothetical protein
MKRVALAEKVDELLAFIPRGRRTAYLDSGVVGVSSRSYYSYRDERYLHRQHGCSFATLAKMSTREIEHEAHHLRHSLHRDRVAEQRRAEREAAGMMLGVFVRSKLDQAARRQAAGWLRRDWDQQIFQEWMLDAVTYPRVELSSEERGRGLTNLMVDSGAFSAANFGESIDLDAYCKFLIDNPLITYYVNLDVINDRDVKESAAQSFKNFQQMRERGLHPIPVFHNREKINWLKQYLDLGCDYIGLGGAGRSILQSWRFYDRCFNIIDSCGRKVRVHAFGVAAPRTLLRFPFASADSTTWILEAQRYEMTNFTRLGGRSWSASLTDHQRIAAGTYLKALDANRLEREIRAQRPFDFYLGFEPNNRWVFPALRLIGHRNALTSYYYVGRDAGTIMQFIDNPDSFLDQEQRYAEAWEMLGYMKSRYSNVRLGLHMRERWRPSLRT